MFLRCPPRTQRENVQTAGRLFHIDKEFLCKHARVIRHLCPSKTFYAPVLACVDVSHIRKITGAKLLIDKLWHALEVVVGFFYEDGCRIRGDIFT